MRKIIVLLLALGLLAGATAAPAAAGKNKKKKQQKIEETFTAKGLPLPNLSSSTGTEQRSCFAGVEGVHKTSQEFEAPGKGQLTFTAEGFTGDWDLAVVFDDGTIVYSLNDQTAGDPPEERIELPLASKQKVTLSACNFVGEPQIEVAYTYVY